MTTPPKTSSNLKLLLAQTIYEPAPSGKKIFQGKTMKNGGAAAYFGENSAQILSRNIMEVYLKFDARLYCHQIAKSALNLSYLQRILAHTNALCELLPMDFARAAEILVANFGGEKTKRKGYVQAFLPDFTTRKFRLDLRAERPNKWTQSPKLQSAARAGTRCGRLSKSDRKHHLK